MGGACGTQRPRAGDPVTALAPEQRVKKADGNNSPNDMKNVASSTRQPSSYAMSGSELRDQKLHPPTKIGFFDGHAATNNNSHAESSETEAEMNHSRTNDPLSGGTSTELENKSASTTANSTMEGFFVPPPARGRGRTPGGATSRGSANEEKTTSKSKFRSFEMLEKLESRSRSNSKTRADAPSHLGSYRSQSRGNLRKTEKDMLNYANRNYESHLNQIGGEQHDSNSTSNAGTGGGKTGGSSLHQPMNAGTPIGMTNPHEKLLPKQGSSQTTSARVEYAQDRTMRGRLLYYGVDFGIAKKVADFADMKTDSSQGNALALPKANLDQGTSLSFLWQCVEFANLSHGEEDQALAKLANFFQEEEFGRLTKSQQKRCQELTGRAMDFLNAQNGSMNPNGAAGPGFGNKYGGSIPPPPPMPTLNKN
ncbi:unnamed protein product [Amoebophrya sp. A120]|nr:unnamed protein product [Amoebophrya sp. A120]|eukprot:GSA120T00024348001.1